MHMYLYVSEINKKILLYIMYRKTQHYDIYFLEPLFWRMFYLSVYSTVFLKCIKNYFKLFLINKHLGTYKIFFVEQLFLMEYNFFEPH